MEFRQSEYFQPDHSVCPAAGDGFDSGGPGYLDCHPGQRSKLSLRTGNSQRECSDDLDAGGKGAIHHERRRNRTSGTSDGDDIHGWFTSILADCPERDRYGELWISARAALYATLSIPGSRHGERLPRRPERNLLAESTLAGPWILGEHQFRGHTWLDRG